MDNKAFIDERIAALEESVKYFGNKNKPERERWVCKQFLMNLGVAFEEADITKSEAEPPDVLFATALFEVKEILDQDRKRHDEYKADLKTAKQAIDPQELLTSFTPKDITPVEVCDLVRQELPQLDSQYSSITRRSMDLVFYVNLQHHMLQGGTLPDLSDLKAWGWRSISALVGRTSFILDAADDAPSFIVGRRGRATTGGGYVE